jgi:hypothetical protein
MIAFAREYPEMRGFLPQPVAELPAAEILPQAVARLCSSDIVQTPSAQLATSDGLVILQQLVAQLPWGQNVILLDKVKDLRARRWYVEQTITHGWSRSVLALQIKSEAYARAGKAVHNFQATLPPPQSDLAEQVLSGLKGVKKAIGVSEYQLTRALPKEFRSSLPTVEQMET